jgi:manganese-dependent inorganic pyrophosphatase
MIKKLVTCYVDPDLDGTAGAIAYAEFLQKNNVEAVAGVVGEPHEEAKYILDRFGFNYPLSVENSKNYEEVVLVDASDVVGLNGKIEPEKVIEIIDHRKINQKEKFTNAKKVQIEFVGAAATLVAEKFMSSNTEISKSSAILLCGAIISNTLNFKATVTTNRDREAFKWLNNFAQLPEKFWKEKYGKFQASEEPTILEMIGEKIGEIFSNFATQN